MEEAKSGENKSSQRRVGILYDERMCNHHTPGGDYHPENPNRITAIWNKLLAHNIPQRCVVLDAKAAEDKYLRLVHSEDHIKLIKSISSKQFDSRRKRIASKLNSIYFNEGSSEAAYIAAGSVVEAAERVARGELNSAAAIVRPPGHHAEHDEAMGFCLFNNVAVATSFILDERPELGIKKILIVDWDVHHGNGTQKMFWKDPRVLFFSVHRHEFGSFYPANDDGFYTMIGEGPGAGYNINVPWENGRCGDADYLAVWDHILIPIAKEFDPDMVIVSAGYDAAVNDPLGGCRLTPYGYSLLLKKLMDFANGKIVLALEGGYNLVSIENSFLACMKVLLEGRPIDGSSEAYPFESTWRVIQEVRKKLSNYWPVLTDELPLKLTNKKAPPPVLMLTMSLAQRMAALRLRTKAKQDLAGTVEDPKVNAPASSSSQAPSSQQPEVPLDQSRNVAPQTQQTAGAEALDRVEPQATVATNDNVEGAFTDLDSLPETTTTNEEELQENSDNIPLQAMLQRASEKQGDESAPLKTSGGIEPGACPATTLSENDASDTSHRAEGAGKKRKVAIAEADPLKRTKVEKVPTGVRGLRTKERYVPVEVLNVPGKGIPAERLSVYNKYDRPQLWRELYQENMSLRVPGIAEDLHRMSLIPSEASLFSSLDNRGLVELNYVRNAMALASSQEVSHRLHKLAKEQADYRVKLDQETTRSIKLGQQRNQFKSQLATAQKELTEAKDAQEKATQEKNDALKQVTDLKQELLDRDEQWGKKVDDVNNLVNTAVSQYNENFKELTDLKAKYEAEKLDRKMASQQLEDAIRRHASELLEEGNKVRDLSSEKISLEKEVEASRDEAKRLAREMVELKTKHEEKVAEMLEREAWRALRYKTRVVMTVKERCPSEDLQFWVDLDPPEDDEEAPDCLSPEFPEPTPSAQLLNVQPVSSVCLEKIISGSVPEIVGDIEPENTVKDLS